MAILGMRSQATPSLYSPEAAAASATVVGLGEAKVLKADDQSHQDECLVAYGLGSCVAICLWDPANRVAAMAHVVLPGADPNGAPNPKFARSAVPALVSLMQRHGAGPDPRRYVARLAGGAEVLALGGTGKLPRMGEQNGVAVREALEAAGVPIQAAELGGNRGRSVWFDPREGGQIRVRAVGSTERYL
jgi:chemotaxis protein CheD